MSASPGKGATKLVVEQPDQSSGLSPQYQLRITRTEDGAGRHGAEPRQKAAAGLTGKFG
jgi:hypothetical protein